MTYDLSFLDEGALHAKCPFAGDHDNPCERKPFGPYYSLAMLRDAVNAHLRAQHANQQPAMYHEQPGDKRIASASKGERTRRGWRF